MTSLLLASVAVAAAAQLPAWEFDDLMDAQDWTPNANLAEVRVEDGALWARSVDGDPQFLCTDLAFPTSARQYVRIVIHSDRPGAAQLFWTGDTTGQWGGLTQEKSLQFAVASGWNDLALFPWWHGEPAIKTLRFDPPSHAELRIERIAVLPWPETEAAPGARAWERDVLDAATPPGADRRFAPIDALDPATAGWAALEIASESPGAAFIEWALANGMSYREGFFVGPDQPGLVNVQLEGLPTWGDGEVVALGVGWAETLEPAPVVYSLTLAEAPVGPPWPEIEFLGRDAGLARAGRPFDVIARIANSGGEPLTGARVRLMPGEGLSLAETPAEQPVPELAHGQMDEIRWTLLAREAGEHAVSVRLDSAEGAVAGEREAVLEVARAVPDELRAEYVPEPVPAETELDVLAYYFPGWDSLGKWAPIDNVAPIRKPLLGWYDESDPEVVDWQIKWAVEHGITGFLVDWYWNQGAQILNHWFDAYREARYRDLLDVAIMWANHNPPGSHTMDDWRVVTREWIEHYFDLPAYYRIDGKPAVFIFSPDLLRTDLGGSEQVAEALRLSDEMARDAGYEGVAFVALTFNRSQNALETLLEEGYVAATAYHQWGPTGDAMTRPARVGWDMVLAETPDDWDRVAERAAPLPWYPPVPTGWDARPWHGVRARVIAGRDVRGFAMLLRAARAYARDRGQERVIISPLNEWGEGSYIEPNIEFGFGMYDAIRETFATNPRPFGVHLTPADVGLGPYDLPETPSPRVWEFEDDAGDWSGMMNLADFRVEDGALRGRSSTGDPAITLNLVGLEAATVDVIEVDITVESAPADPGAVQLFWALERRATSESTSMSLPLETGRNVLRFAVGEHPRWRGRIPMLRLDPGSQSGIVFAIDRIALLP